MARKGQYHKVKKQSDGYKAGIRWIDFGDKESDPVRYLKKRPW